MAYIIKYFIHAMKHFNISISIGDKHFISFVHIDKSINKHEEKVTIRFEKFTKTYET